jgi:SPP1 family predicted phage head-tail adaptor
MSDTVPIGALRERLTLEAPSRVDDGGGGATITWIEVAILWARIVPRSGSESHELDRIAGKASHDVTIRHRGDVSPEKRFRLGGRVFDIRAAFDPDGRRHWLKCLVEERDL